MEEKIKVAKKWLNRAVDLADKLVLSAIALGTLVLAIQMVATLALEFVNVVPHSLPNIVSELMFVLIVMELFRQIVRQIRQEPFSLKPFLAIGIIASVRGLLVVQMKIGIGDLDWNTGSLTLVAFSLVILLLIAAYYLCHKSEATPS
jgi:uncharacterized membrane protein (DUF373 family)